MNKALFKYILLIFISLNFLLVANSQGVINNSDTINRLDANKNKYGWWIYLYTNETKKIEKEGNFVNNKKHGIWKSYYLNGNLKSEITYINNRPNGYAKIYYETGKLSEEGIWQGTKWVGKYNFYHENGEKAYEWSFNEKGKRSGIQKYYYPSGKLRIEGDWREGKENGVIKEYDEKGSLKSEKFFAAGQFNEKSSKFYAEKKVSVDEIPDDTNATISKEHIDNENNENSYEVFDGNGNHKLYNAFKKIDREGEFRNGKLIDGKRYYYNSDGLLIKTVIYKNGRITEVIKN
ncbi:MAG: toxin-antitoxin system YwqK family antitoxin [Bacteroidales bacterium]|nr:toxin-antitoxin system YwqK family antitoxin [Bacteroidales bacterium]MBN2756935.1 toxin-antitoxin system YwqK family antitoxin [Bacteroidales bacterium]